MATNRPIYEQYGSDFIPGATGVPSTGNPSGRARKVMSAEERTALAAGFAPQGLEAFAAGDPDPVRRAERTKIIRRYLGLEADRNALNARRAFSVMAGAGENLLEQSRVGGLISQPLLSRGSLG